MCGGGCSYGVFLCGCCARKWLLLCVLQNDVMCDRRHHIYMYQACYLLATDPSFRHRIIATGPPGSLIDQAASLLHAPWEPFAEHQSLWNAVRAALATVPGAHADCADNDLLSTAQAVVVNAPASTQAAVRGCRLLNKPINTPLRCCTQGAHAQLSDALETACSADAAMRNRVRGAASCSIVRHGAHSEVPTALLKALHCEPSAALRDVFASALSTYLETHHEDDADSRTCGWLAH